MSEYDAPALPMLSSDGLNIPSKPTGDGTAQGKGQRARRYADTFFDQHVHPTRFPMGRPWTGERELAANPDLMHPDGFITTDLQQGVYVADDFGTVDRRATFLSGWTAPWTPLSKYFKFDYRRKKIRFDYQAGRAEHQQSYERYFESAAKLGAEMNMRVDYGVIPHFQLTAKLGLPTNLVKVFEAAIAGDPWLLGFVDEPNVELAAILGYTSAGIRRPTSYIPEPVVTPEQVLATPSTELLRMVADMQAKMEQMQRDLDATRMQAAPTAPKSPKASRPLASAGADAT